MALNFCTICDQSFNETFRNPGNICPDCKELKNGSESDFENYMIKKEEQAIKVEQPAPPFPSAARFYRVK